MICISQSRQKDKFTLHVDVYDDDFVLQSSRTKSGMTFTEWRIAFHLVAQAIQRLETWEALTNWTNDNLKVARTGLAVSDAVNKLYKVTAGKTVQTELLSEEPRRFLLLDFAHHAQLLFFTDLE